MCVYFQFVYSRINDVLTVLRLAPLGAMTIFKIFLFFSQKCDIICCENRIIHIFKCSLKEQCTKVYIVQYYHPCYSTNIDDDRLFLTSKSDPRNEVRLLQASL